MAPARPCGLRRSQGGDQIYRLLRHAEQTSVVSMPPKLWSTPDLDAVAHAARKRTVRPLLPRGRGSVAASEQAGANACFCALSSMRALQCGQEGIHTAVSEGKFDSTLSVKDNGRHGGDWRT
ncbi:hypothetical protein GCM10029978_065500 [Actinoallomurus acanthiterrae]